MLKQGDCSRLAIMHCCCGKPFLTELMDASPQVIRSEMQHFVDWYPCLKPHSLSVCLSGCLSVCNTLHGEHDNTSPTGFSDCIHADKLLIYIHL